MYNFENSETVVEEGTDGYQIDHFRGPFKSFKKISVIFNLLSGLSLFCISDVIIRLT